MLPVPKRPPGAQRPGITLSELLIVIGIIAILLGLLLPAVQRVREAANRAQCASNLKEIALAVHSYHNVFNRIPCNQFGPYGGGPNSFAWSWLARLLPYIEQNNLYTDGQIPLQTLEQSGVISAQIPIFFCPSDNAYLGPRLDAGNLTGVAVGQTNYKGVSGSNWGDDIDGVGVNFPTHWRHHGSNGSFDGHSSGDGMFYRMDYLRPLNLMQIGDGTSNTFVIGEYGKSPRVSWSARSNIPCHSCLIIGRRRAKAAISSPSARTGHRAWPGWPLTGDKRFVTAIMTAGCQRVPGLREYTQPRPPTVARPTHQVSSVFVQARRQFATN
jgi:type II secretory pathway pseudopilin PulG